MALGARIEERLNALHISQAELARRAGVSQSTMNTIIRRPTRSSPHLVAIAQALKTTPAYLTGETDNPESETADLDLSAQERHWIELLRGLHRADREAVMQLTRSLAVSAESPAIHASASTTVHDERRDYRTD